MNNWVKRECGLLAVSLAVGILIALSVAAYTYVYSAVTQLNIAENVIRFHVMAHSDSAEEQDLKEHVRTEILEEFASTLSTLTNIEETRETISEMLPALKEYAESIVRSAGLDHEVTAEMATVFFPTQYYGNIAFPPGNYEAVQITIGDGTGQNWWCLMFPPLCYVDMTATDEGRQQLAETVSEEGFRLLMHQEEASPELVVRFRVVEWWQNLLQPDSTPIQEQPPAQQIVRR